MIADDFDSIEDLEGASLSTLRLRQWMVVELARKADSVDFEQRLNQKADDVDVKDTTKRLSKIENEFAEQRKISREQILQGTAVFLGAFAFPLASKVVAAIGCIGSLAAATAERKEPYCRSWRLWRWNYTRVAVTDGTDDEESE